jgi:hypothetical protein
LNFTDFLVEEHKGRGLMALCVHYSGVITLFLKVLADYKEKTVKDKRFKWKRDRSNPLCQNPPIPA